MEQNMMIHANGLVYSALLDWIEFLQPGENRVAAARKMAEKVVDDVLSAFGIEYVPNVNEESALKPGATIAGFERLTIRARPGSQFQIAAADHIAKHRLTRDDKLVDVIFHAFGDNVSNTTIFLGPRASLAPAIPTVAYSVDKPVLRKT